MKHLFGKPPRDVPASPARPSSRAGDTVSRRPKQATGPRGEGHGQQLLNFKSAIVVSSCFARGKGETSKVVMLLCKKITHRREIEKIFGQPAKLMQRHLARVVEQTFDRKPGPGTASLRKALGHSGTAGAWPPRPRPPPPTALIQNVLD